jgi:hypothetical protein
VLPKTKILQTLTDDLLRKGVIRPSKSPYDCPASLVPKAGGDLRMVVDYRKVSRAVLASVI